MAIINMHIPKNGGSTFRDILFKEFNESEIFDLKIIDNAKMNKDEFINMSDNERHKIKLLSGHLEFGFHDLMPANTKYITFLRNPIDRIISLYNYVYSRPNHRLYNIVSQNSFSDFVEAIDDYDSHNGQVRRISGIDTDGEEM